MNLEHVKIERMDSYPTSKDFVEENKQPFIENFSTMHTHDILSYARSRNLQYLEWADMVSLVHELAARLEDSYVNAVDKEGRSP